MAGTSPAMTSGSTADIAALAAAIAVEALAHFLAGLEEGHGFLLDRDMRAGARIASGAGGTALHREGAKAAQLDPVAARHRAGDFVEDGVDDVLDVALIKMRILRSD